MTAEEQLRARREAWKNLNAAGYMLDALMALIAAGNVELAIRTTEVFHGYLRAFDRDFEPVRAEFAGRPVKRMEPRQ